MKKRVLYLCLVAGAILASGCIKETTVTVNPSLLPGKWYATDIPTEYWRFDVAGTGHTWDESEDVHEGEGTDFNWTTLLNQLRIDLYGQMGQHVYYDWTVTRQTADTLTFKDQYDNPRTFVKL